MTGISCKKIFSIAIIAFCIAMVNPLHALAAQKIILAFGDSLTAGYGIQLDQAFPAQLEKKLRAEGHDATVINAGVSGDTTSGGLTRLEWTLDQKKPGYVILELGSNDMLRAVDPKVTRDNLKKMLDILKSRKIPVLLSGTRAAPNLGISFGDKYQSMYKELAEEYDAIYYPFFLDGVFWEPKLMQQDGLHPNAEGVAAIVDKIYSKVEDLLEK